VRREFQWRSRVPPIKYPPYKGASKEVTHTNLKYALAAVTIVALISVSAFAFIGNAAYAKSNTSGNHQNQNNQDNEERQSKLTNFQDRFNFFQLGFSTFQSIRTGNTTTVFYLSVKNSGIPTITTAMLNASLTKDVNETNAMANWVAGILSVQKLVEYNDTNHDGLFTPGNDTQLQVVNFASLDWTLSTAQITKANVTGYNISMSASDRGATYTIIAQVFNTGVTLSNGIPVSPSEVKVDFGFANFPWNGTASRLALFSLFGGVSNSFTATKTDNSTDVVKYKNAFSYFTWNKNATVDGNPVTVTSTSKGNGALQEVQLNYPHGTNIVHDPIIGVLSGTPTAQTIPTLQPSAVATATGTAAFPGFYFLTATAIVVLGVAALALIARKRMVEPKLQF
jgi:hypothetical protein